MTDLDFSIDIDTNEMLRKLGEVDDVRQDVENKAKETIQFINTETKLSFRNVISMARVGWIATQAIIRGMGGTISTLFRSFITAGLQAISILYPIITAEAVTPGMQVQAALGAASIQMAVGAIQAAEQQQERFAEMLHNTNMIIMSIQSMIGGLNFL